MKFPFADAPDTAVITCVHVLEKGAPVLYVSHDEEDGMWQFLCGKRHTNDEARIAALMEIYCLDCSIGALKDMPCGCCAGRKSRKAGWIVNRK